MKDIQTRDKINKKNHYLRSGKLVVVKKDTHLLRLIYIISKK
jgi:hypothetical protein